MTDFAATRLKLAEHRATAEALRAADMEHRLRHAQAGLREVQTLAEKEIQRACDLLDGAGVKWAEREAARKAMTPLLERIADAITASIVCSCAEHDGVRQVPTPAEVEAAFLERRPVRVGGPRVPHLRVVPCGRTVAEEHFAATDDGRADQHGEGPGAA